MDNTSIILRPIGRVCSPVSKGVDCGWGEVRSEIIIDDAYADGLSGLKQFSHIWVLFYMHKADFDKSRHLLRRPQERSDMPLTGIFAQRAKHRPNPIGITAAEVVDVCESRILVKGLDAIDGSLVLDIKPYYPQYDKKEAAVPNWVDVLMDGYF
ncbi:MAG: tRNA (N6-threonylcarbamoyladenosine(37)-N6)-methyltransferase TrmO [Oscillospiraceae bacterium]|nr:tRNA (N6-threonylcarbamoyladenosine(37)-N6)-methyltransferase TrmO [Oscillospiraceae bacterium]